MLVGRDVFTIQRERGIAVSNLQVAEDLIVSPVFLDDVNDVPDGILAGGEGNCARVRVQQVVALDGLAKFRKLFQSGGEVQPGDGAPEHCCGVAGRF